MRRTLSLIILSGLLMGCPNGGGEGGGGSNAATGTTVSGSVQAPNGQIAFDHARGFFERLAHLIYPTVYASISGLSAVPDGTPVQLARFNATVTGVTILSTTTTSGGRYSFNLDKLGIQFSNDLIVQVAGATGKMIRAFVTNATADLDPGSELAVRLVLEQLASNPGTTFSNFTLKEVNDLSASVKVLTTVKQLSAGADLETTIVTIRNAVLAQSDLMAFITAAVTAGQTTQGPGDVANYFPFTQGNAWNFEGTHGETGQASITFQNTLSINGTKLVGGITATVLSETNPDGSATPEDEYWTKENTGLTIHGNSDPTDHITPQIVPYQELQFPLQAGASFQPVTKSGLDFGADLDGDGRNETATVSSQVTVVDIETVSVSAGNFPNTAQIRLQVTFTVMLSKTGSTITVQETQTIWLAPGIGPVKRQDVTQAQGITETTSEELTSYVVNGQGAGTVHLSITTSVSQANSDETDPGPSGIASDGTNYLVVYCQDLVAPTGLYGKLSANGAGQPFLIGTSGCGSEQSPGVAFDGTNYLVTYALNGNIMGVRVSPSGTVLDGSGGFTISLGANSTVGENAFPSVAFDGTNYLVVYGKFTGTGYNLYGIRVTPVGQALGEFPIYTAPGSHALPRVVFGGSTYLVVWPDQVTASGANGFITTQHILGARVSTDGVVLDPNGIAIATAPGPQGNPSLAFDGTNYLVVWLDGTQDPVPLYGKRVKTDGTLLDGSASSLGIPIETTVTGKHDPTVTFDGTNHLVAWTVVQGQNLNAPPNGIYSAKVSPGGQVISSLSNPQGVLLQGPPQDRFALFVNTVAYSNQTSTLITWTNNEQLQGTTKSIQGLLIFQK